MNEAGKNMITFRLRTRPITFGLVAAICCSTGMVGTIFVMRAAEALNDPVVNQSLPGGIAIGWIWALTLIVQTCFDHRPRTEEGPPIAASAVDDALTRVAGGTPLFDVATELGVDRWRLADACAKRQAGKSW